MNSSFYNHSVSSSLLYRGTTSTIVTVIVVALGIIINYINGTLVHTFRKHQIFYMNPRYILYIHLVLNDTIYLFTSVSMFVFSYTLYNMSVSLCCLFIVVALFTSHNTPLNLALMAVECYIAVCFPLRYAEFCTNKRIYIVIGCVWVFSSLSFMTDMFFYLAKDPFWLFNSIPICNKDKLFSHPVSVQKEEIIYLLYLTIVWFTLIFTYLKIYFAAQAANSANSEQKARNTILLHGFQLLLSMLTYVDPMIKKHFVNVPQYFIELQCFWFIFVHILPRVVSPIVYGLRDRTFRQCLKNYLFCNIRASNKLYHRRKPQLVL
nr:odorant receptor 131-2 [Nothobranchius furzeri]